MRRYTIDLGVEMDALLTDLAENKRVTKSEIIRRAVTSYALLTRQTANDRKLSVTDQQDRVIKDILLP